MEPATSSWLKYLGYLLSAIVLIFIYSWITSPMIVTVTGSGDVSAKAETATLTFTLASVAENPQSATQNLKLNIEKVKESLKSSGILENEVFESKVSVLPASTISKDLSGFQASTSMGIKTTQISNLNSLISNLYDLGAIVVTQPTLSVGDINQLEKEAYNLALKDAGSKASGIALSNWKFIKKIILVEQSVTQPTSTVTTKADTASQIENKLSPDDGLIKVSKVLSVSYKMW